jgi:ATP-dependent Lon protease
MKIVPVKWIDEVLDLALERPLPGRAASAGTEQPPLPKNGDVARPDVKH